MTDMRVGIWPELRSGNSIDLYRRNLQKAYIDRMEYLINEEYESSFRNPTKINVSQSDIRSAAKANLKRISRDVKGAIPRMTGMPRYHLEDVMDRIDLILNPR